MSSRSLHKEKEKILCRTAKSGGGTSRGLSGFYSFCGPCGLLRMPGRQHFLAARAQGRRCGQKNQPLRRPRRRVGQGAARGDEKKQRPKGPQPFAATGGLPVPALWRIGGRGVGRRFAEGHGQLPIFFRRAAFFLRNMPALAMIKTKHPPKEAPVQNLCRRSGKRRKTCLISTRS